MIIEIITIVVATIGILIISVVIASIIGHFFIKGLQTLLLYLLPPHQLSSDDNCNNENQTNHNNLETTINDTDRYPFDIRHYDPCYFWHNFITSTSRHQKNNSDNKWYKEYSKCYLPRPTPRSIPLPIKHIGNIVARLRKLVNQSGKEPCSNDLTHSVLNSGTDFL